MDYHTVVIEIPGHLAIETVETGQLPDGWPEGDDERKTAAIGTKWARALRTAVLKVPSAAARPEHTDVPATERIDPRLRKSALNKGPKAQHFS